MPRSPRRLQHTQVRRAFGADDHHPARPGTLATPEPGADTVVVRFLDDRSTAVVGVSDPARLAETLTRTDLCRWRDEPLVLVNPFYRVLGVATGPATPPQHLVVLVGVPPRGRRGRGVDG